jgi:transcription antitermination factor NusG
MSEEKAWYIVHTQTGHEDKVREKIQLNVEIQGLETAFLTCWFPPKKSLK